MTRAIETVVPEFTGESMAKAVADAFGDEVNPELVQAIFARAESLRGGDPLGTVRKNPDTGVIAVRVDQGVYSWCFVTPATAEVFFDQSAHPDWPVLEG